jgi:hypothetical protein
MFCQWRDGIGRQKEYSVSGGTGLVDRRNIPSVEGQDWSTGGIFFPSARKHRINYKYQSSDRDLKRNIRNIPPVDQSRPFNPTRRHEDALSMHLLLSFETGNLLLYSCINTATTYNYTQLYSRVYIATIHNYIHNYTQLFTTIYNYTQLYSLVYIVTIHNDTQSSIYSRLVYFF